MPFGVVFVIVASLVTLVVFAGLIFEGLRVRAQNRLKELELRVRLAEAEKGGGGPAADLEERVRVLERIATDPAPRLADEIESLRIKEFVK